MTGTAEFSKVWNAFRPLPVPAVLRAVPGLGIWLADLGPCQAAATELARLLDATERAEVDRLRQPADRVGLVLRRGARRICLARYLGCAPADIRFERGRFGKPAIATGAGLKFNASRSGAWFCIAVARCVELGLDLERVSGFELPEDGLESVCSAAECRALAALPELQRATAFLRLWTAKEAVLKLRGGGFREPADVSGLLQNLRPGETVAAVDAGAGFVVHLAVACA